MHAHCWSSAHTIFLLLRWWACILSYVPTLFCTFAALLSVLQPCCVLRWWACILVCWAACTTTFSRTQHGWRTSRRKDLEFLSPPLTPKRKWPMAKQMPCTCSPPKISAQHSVESGVQVLLICWLCAHTRAHAHTHTCARAHLAKLAQVASLRCIH